MSGKINRTSALLCLISASALLACVPSAGACPAQTQNLHTTHLGGSTICQVVDRYEKVKSKLLAAGLVPERLANAVAPRFIKADYWEKIRTDKSYNPWIVYDPSPGTWGKWERAREEVDESAKKNFENSVIPKLSLDWVLALHGSNMNGLMEGAGHLRTSDVIGAAVDRSKSVPIALVAVLEKNLYRTSSGDPLVSWTPTNCYEDVDGAYRSSHPNPSLDDQISMVMGTTARNFKDPEGIERQCGYFVYARNEEIGTQLEMWVRDLNHRSGAAFDFPEIDPFVTAARAQKWFISIHPFYDGNGRTSRFVMDYLLESIGLPPAVLKDMDLDLLTSEQNWAEEIGKGILRTLKILEGCARTPSEPGCQTVPIEPN